MVDITELAARERQRDYWLNRAGEPPVRNALIDLLSGRAEAPPRPATSEWTFPEPVSRNILSVCNDSDLSLYILLLTMVEAVAARSTGANDVTILSPAYHADGTVLVQGRIRPGEDLRSNVLATRRTVVAAYSNQEITLAEIFGAHAGEITRNNPLCVSGNLHPPGPHDSPLELCFTRRGADITCSVTFDSARLRPGLVAEFCANLEAFAEAASSDYGVPVGEVQWLRGDRLDQVTACSRGPVTETPDAALHELFAASARRAPERTALIHAGRAVTYAELDALAGAVAGKLGVRPGDVVALRTADAIETVATMLGVLKAGAAFAPISPDDPANRLRRLVDKAGATLLVAGDGQASRLRAPATAAGAPAYVIFTSGTTGEPKAVVVEHRGIVNAVAWKIRTYQWGPESRILPLFGPEFDGFVLNVFAPLCAGAAVVLASEDDRRRPAGIDLTGVTDLVTAPLLYDAVLDHVTGTLRRVTLAGEAADPAKLRRLPNVRLSNEYGPAEASVVATYHPDLDPDSATVIGSPIDNVTVYLLDPRGRLVPPGVVGEIYIGGRGLARGSHEEIRGEPLYRTGDLGMRLQDGTIEFRGRRDGYVKIRGRRVDLAEVRAQIVKHGAGDAFVRHVGGPTDGVLSAYVVAPPAALADIESALREDLPPTMIPGRFVALDRMPVTPGGKVDVAALRDSAAAHREPPADDVQRRLVEIWRRVLDTPHVGIDDSFFALGGHSLRAIQLLADIQETFGVELGLHDVFSANTVRRLAEVLAARPAEPGPGPAGDRGLLSSAQERMLTLAGEHPLSYNLPVLFALDADLDLPHLQVAVQAVVDRHDSLRASFRFVNDRWAQHFHDTLPVKITERAIPGDVDVEATIRSELVPFDLEAAPLFRVELFTVHGRHAYLLFDFHHIVIDEVSLEIVLREIATGYNGGYAEAGAPPSYADFAAAQQRRRDSDEYRADRDAVAGRLRDARLEPLRLPYDFPAPRRRSHDGGLVRRGIPDEVMAGARRVCADNRTTDFMFFMAVFGLLLHKFTHQPAMVIGAPVSLRSTAATRDLVGLCLNTVPFKLIVPDDAPFPEYLRDVADGIIEDLGHSAIELDDVVKALRPDRHPGENPLYSVLLHIVDSSVTRLPLDGTGARYLPVYTGTSKMDLILELDLAEGGSSFSLEFPTERFRQSTIERLADNLVTLLREIVARPDTPTSGLQVLGPAEREQLLAWGGARRSGPYAEGSLAGHFEQRVRERPDDVALVFGDERITFGELNTRSNRLAHRLRALGCRENDVAAVFCDRSPAAVVAILAVQKAGAAHLPLDPFYPAARTSRMLADSGASVLITDRADTGLSFAGAVVHADADHREFSAGNPGVSPRPESLGYVLYTSGTTGDPKGVMVAQRNLVTLVRRTTAHLSIDRHDVWTLFHSPCFDVSVWEMFGCLLSGGRLVIVPREITADPDRLMALIEKNRVTVLCQPPSAFYLLAYAMVHAGSDTSIRYVMLGGEALKTENLKDWHERHVHATLINGYGITETTIYSTFKVITADDIVRRTRSIGRPVPGTYVHILGPGGSPCPIGVTGELHIGGLGVGLGYRGRPELTARRFVADPLLPGNVLYRSGDLVRWLPDGEIEYLGRADTQVKVRGYRVEIGEIEATMSAHDGIRESVVLAEARGETTQLVGFFTAGHPADVGRLRSHLETQLPDYMVPTRLLQVDRIPTTPNGKVDRELLLSTLAAAPHDPKRSPDGPVARAVVEAWAEILGVPAGEIGVDDSFFALGGDSIGANLVVRMLANRGLPVELADVFENPTVGALAGIIAGAAAAPAPARKTRVLLDVQPFTELFFRDCTHQALAAAVGHLAGDVRPLLANTTAVCVRDPGRSLGLRVRPHYLERRPPAEVLAKAGIAVRRSTGSADIRKDLLECLAHGQLGIIKVDCFFVERQTDLYRTRHGDHTILVCGYDTESRLFEIIDNEAARDVRYRRTTISFGELSDAYEGYQSRFNANGADASFVVVSRQPRDGRGPDLQAAVRETLGLAGEWRDEEAAALATLHADFCAATGDEGRLMGHVQQLSYTIGELVTAKRLLAYQLRHILGDAPVADVVNEVVARLETVHGLLTKARLSGELPAGKVSSMRSRLDEVRVLDLDYAVRIGRLLKGGR